MALFFCSTKYFRCLRNISKCIQIINSKKNCLCSAHDELVLKERDLVNQQTKESSIDNVLKKIDIKFKHRKMIDKHLVEDIIHCIEMKGGLKSSQALLSLRCCNFLKTYTQEQRIIFTNTLWKLYNIYNIPMNINLYNELLQVYIENKYKFSPLQILSNMKKQSIKPNTVTYKKLLEYYCRNGNLSEMKIILQYLKNKMQFLDIDVFNLLIMGYSEAGKLNWAKEVLNVIKEINLTPSKETYIALMCAFAKYNDIKSIQEILCKYQQEGVNFKNEDILDVIYTLIVNRNVDHVDKMLAILEKPYHAEGIKFFGKIIDIKQEDIATKIFFYMYPDIESNVLKNEYESFFINKFICSNVIPKKIINICSHFYTLFDNKKIFTEAIHISFKHGNYSLSLKLLQEWKYKGHKLRPHYFWPFLIEAQENHDIKDLLKYIKDMITVYNVAPCVNTIANFIIPNLLGSNSSSTSLLEEYGIPKETIRNAIVYYLLKQNKTKSAYMYVVKNAALYSDFVLGKTLKHALYNTYDIDSYLEIVKHLHMETNTGTQIKVSLTDKIVDIMDFLHKNPTNISKVVDYILKHKLQISNEIYAVLLENDNKNLMNEKMEHVESITTNDSSMTSTTQMENEQKQLNNSISKQLHSSTPCDSIMTFKLFLRSKRWNTTIPRGMNTFIAQELSKQYTSEESKMIIKKLINEYPICATSKLCLTYAQNLISAGNLDDAAEIIEYTGRIIKVNSNLLENDTESLLNEAALTGNDRIVKRFYDILLNIKYVKLPLNFLDLLILVHIKQDNIIKALDIAEILSEKYKHIPALRKLIESVVLTKDAELLQRFINIATTNYEEQYILIELMLCFLKNNFEEEARKIMKLFSTSNYKFTNIQESLQDSFKGRNTKILEKLLDLSVDYPDTDRSIIYECLIEIYVKKRHYKYGLNLWKRMQKEKVSPTDKLNTYIIKLFR